MDPCPTGSSRWHLKVISHTSHHLVEQDDISSITRNTWKVLSWKLDVWKFSLLEFISEWAPFCHLIAMETLFAYFLSVCMFSSLEFRASALLSLDCHENSMAHPSIHNNSIHLIWCRKSIPMHLSACTLLWGVFHTFPCIYHFQTSVSSVSINMGKKLSFYKKVVMFFSGLSWLSRSLPHCYRTLLGHEISWAGIPKKLHK